VIRLTRLSEWLLRQPLVWGGLASMAFYALIVQQAQPGSLVARAFAGELRQFKIAATLVCFAGLAALVMRLAALAIEFGALERSAMPASQGGAAPREGAEELLAELDAAPSSWVSALIGRRLRQALEMTRLRGAADQMDADLAILAEDDRRELVDRYAPLRYATACLPLVGLAGAAAALAAGAGGATGQPVDAALPAMLGGVGAACSALLQAIALTILLVLAAVPVKRLELRLLATVDQTARRELMGRFGVDATDRDRHVATIQRMCANVLQTVEAAAERHDATMARSMAGAMRKWEELASSAASLVHRSVAEAAGAGLKQRADAMSASVARLAADLQGTVVRHAEILGDNIDSHAAALADALEHHTAVMKETETSLAAENRRHLAEMEATLGEAMVLAATRQEKLIQQSEDLLKEMQVALVEAAGTTVAQQEQLIKQSDVLLRVVEATGQVRKLEEALNSNLLALSASHDFEQTVTSLAAAVQLLSVRLRQPAIVRNEVDLGRADTTSQAA
jgi:hypothetical protein